MRVSALQSLYAGDQYLLQDGHKAARVKPIVSVKQGCPLSLLLFSLYINDIGSIAEGVQEAVTGTEDVRVTHMLYADDLTLLANASDAMQTMLNRPWACGLCTLQTPDHQHCKNRGGPLQLKARCSGAHFYVSRRCFEVL